MHIERVTANGFGALPPGSSLELGPGLNVVAGPNEAAKSTWHAAVYAALCGKRRSRGTPRKDEREFQRRHEPRSGGPWTVNAQVALADGRRVELTHDLGGRVACRAQDRDLARDVSSEIMTEGSPDGARWLGLDRRSFASTAVVRQTQLLSVLDDAGQLQEQLQHAAATAGADGTAAAALDRLMDYEKQHVGREASNAKRPLQNAVTAVRAARALLAEAERQHTEYVDLGREAESREEEVRAAQEALTIAETSLAAQQTTVAAEREHQRAEHVRRAAEREQQAEAAVAAATVEVEAARAQTTAGLTAARALVEEWRRELGAARGRLEAAEEARDQALVAAASAVRARAEAESERQVAEAREQVQRASAELRERRTALVEQRAELETSVARAVAAAGEARNRSDEAQVALDAARAEEVGAAARLVEADRAVADANGALESAQGALTGAEQRVERLAELDARLGVQPARDFLADDELAARIAAALRAWSSRPELPVLDGVCAAALREEVAALPEHPAGDRSVAAAVEAAARAVTAADDALAAHGASRPADPEPDPAPEVRDDELLELLRDLAPLPPAPPPAVPSLSLPVGVLTCLVLAAVAGFVLAGPAVGAAFSVLSVGAGAWAVRQVSRRAEALAAARVQEEARLERQGAQDRAAARCAELGCEPTDAGLRQFRWDLLDRREQAARARSEMASWAGARPGLEERCEAARSVLVSAVRERGFSGGHEGLDAGALLQQYAAWCRDNDAQARLASRRDDLTATLSARVAAESAAEQARNAVERAEQELRGAADAAGVARNSPQDLVLGLTAVEARRRDGLAERDAAVRVAAEREQLLAGQTPAEVALAVDRARVAVDSARASIDDAASARELARGAHEQAQQRRAAAQESLDLRHAEAEAADRKVAALHPGQVDGTAVGEAENRLEQAQEVLAQTIRAGAAAVQSAVESVDTALLPEQQPVATAGEQVVTAERALVEAEVAAEVAREDGQRRRDAAEELLTRARQEAIASARLTAAEADALEEPVIVDEAAVLARPRAALATAREQLAQITGTLEERARAMPDVAAAQEQLAAAVLEEERVRALARTLATTRALLEKAQDEVHRDFAPRLVELVRPWLRHVTGGRYVDLSVDPQTLGVTVYDRQRQACDAALLSRGTTEQVYLLLRVALAQLLVTAPGESAPLLLDDTTVQCDAARTAAVLDLLHLLSADRQIVVFSQELAVVEWARRSLTERDRLIELDPGDLLGGVSRAALPPSTAAA